MKKATHSEEQSRPRKANDTTKPSTKIAQILSHMIAGNSLNRFEAERIGDHCLNSTIAVLANRHGLKFQRQRERVPNRFGTHTDVTRYSLPAAQHEHALNAMRHLNAGANRGVLGHG